MIIPVLIGVLIAFGSGEEYSATTRILPYRSALSMSAGNLSGLAGLAGVRLPSGVADQTITAELYPVVARSSDFRISVVETPIRFSSLGRKVTAMEYFQDIRHKPLTELIVGYSVGLPGELRKAFSEAEAPLSAKVLSSDSTPTLVSYSKQYLKQLQRLERRLSVSIDKKTSVITITGMMPDPHAAADLVRVTASRLMDRIIEYESRKAAEQFRFVNEQYLQAKGRYERAQREVAVFSDRNRALMSATAQIDRDRLQREYELSFEVFQQFSRELEQARIKMNQDTPVFTTLEQVMVPAERSQPKRTLVLLISLLFGVALGAARIGLRELLAKSHYQEMV